MNKVVRQLQTEKRFLFPAGLTLVWLGLITAVLPLLARAGLPEAPVILSVIWFTAGYFFGLRRETSGKKLGLFLDSAAAILLWTAIHFLVLDSRTFLNGLLFRSLWPFWGLVLLALISWRAGSFFFGMIRLPFLVPLKREQLGEDFHNWLHNYMQGHSARRSVTNARHAVLLILFMTVTAHAVSMQFGTVPGLPAFLPAAAAGICGLILISTLYRLSVYTGWIIDGVHVQRDFFRIWFRFASIAVISAGLVLALLPTGIELINREKLLKGFSGLLRSINKTGQHRDDRTGRDRPDPDKKNRERDRKLNELKTEKEPPLKKVLRVVLYAGAFLFLLALVGGIVNFVYRGRYEPPPRIFRFPVMLWEILRKFLQIFGYMFRLFFLAGYRRRTGRSISNARQSMEELLPAAPELSDEKKREIREIIATYLRFVEEAGSRGFVYRKGETPREYRDRLSEVLPGIDRPSEQLTGSFYRCRYSPLPAGRQVLDEAVDALSGCMDVLAGIERVL